MSGGTNQGAHSHILTNLPAVHDLYIYTSTRRQRTCSLDNLQVNAYPRPVLEEDHYYRLG